MAIPIPTEADQNTRRAFQDAENRIAALEKRLAKMDQRAPVTVAAKKTYEDTELLKSAHFDGDVRIENDLEVRGDVNMPNLYDGLIEPFPWNGTDPSRIINVKGSVAIAPGGLSADSLRGRILDVPPSERNMPDLTYTRLVDDFIFSGPVTATDDGKIGELGWNYIDNVGSAPTLYNDSSGHVGCIYIGNSSMTANTHYCSLYARATQYLYPVGGVNRVRDAWVIRVGASNTDCKFRLGMMDNVSYSGQDDQISFVLDNSNFDTNFRVISEADGSSTTTDAGVTAETTQWYVLSYDWDLNKREVKFYIDGSLVATHAGDSVPGTGTTESQMMPALSIRYIENSWRTVVLDYYSHEVWTARGKA